MTENQNGKFRPKKINFAPVSNSALKDPRLSLKAKGLYALIQSYITMPNFLLNKGWLRDRCREGEKAFDSAWKELKDCGFLKQYRIPNGKNDTFRYEYELLDEADESRPALITLNKRGERIPAKHFENGSISHTPQNGGSAKVEISNNKASISSKTDQTAKTEIWHIPQNGGYANSFSDSHTPRFVPYANGTPCEAHPVPKGGYISNTHDYNTQDNKTKTLKSVSHSDVMSDRLIDSFREKLKEQIDYDYFEENFPDDLSGVDSLLDCMVDMMFVPDTKINGVMQSRAALQKYVDKVGSSDILEFIEHMRDKPMRNVKNVSAYWRTSFINFLRERDLILLTV